MPYIKQSERAQLDELIDALITRIKPVTLVEHTINTLAGPVGKVVDEGKLDLTAEDHGYMAGRLNYVVTRLVIGLLGGNKYWKIALYCGVLSNIASEFYRKLAIPYEDAKIAENGDVYPPA